MPVAQILDELGKVADVAADAVEAVDNDGGKGLAGVVIKDDKYFNPFIEVMKGKVGA